MKGHVVFLFHHSPSAAFHLGPYFDLTVDTSSGLVNGHRDSFPLPLYPPRKTKIYHSRVGAKSPSVAHPLQNSLNPVVGMGKEKCPHPALEEGANLCIRATCCCNHNFSGSHARKGRRGVFSAFYVPSGPNAAAAVGNCHFSLPLRDQG